MPPPTNNKNDRKPAGKEGCFQPAEFYRRHTKAVIIGAVVIAVLILLIIIIVLVVVLTSKSGMDKEMKQAFLDHHNFHRYQIANGLVGRQPSGSDIVLLDWDERLAKNIEKWTKGCEFKHNSMQDRKVGSYEHGGQNLAGWSWVGAKALEGVWSWFEEEKEFNYDSHEAPAGVLHYTQMIWAETVAVGCYVANCTGRHLFQTQLGCDYAPMGNWVGQKPYKRGSPCSACPSNFPKCHEGLCATAKQCSSGKLSCTDSTTTSKSIPLHRHENPSDVIARVVKNLKKPDNPNTG